MTTLPARFGLYLFYLHQVTHLCVVRGIKSGCFTSSMPEQAILLAISSG